MTPLELLAPAKNLECGIAAIDHGADAVYIGAPQFGARAAAVNSIDDIAALCRYAHRYRARVYVTVNTLVYDQELAAARQLVDDLCAIGVDALLVQDMALVGMAAEAAARHQRPLALHASTQTDNRSAAKVRWLGSMGFSRVVLAREVSLAQMAAIHREVPEVELEAFVHGALCVSYSGVCYASQYCFSRSANRGECAQFCRLKFALTDAAGHPVDRQRHWLSLRDMCRIDHLAEMADAGVTSFKIEGRLKDVAYVKNVVAAYSQALDKVVARSGGRYRRSSLGGSTVSFVPNLQKTFNRGFTPYFLLSDDDEVASPDTPKALGEYVGRVKEVGRDSFSVAGLASFANGDGLCFFDAAHELQGFRVNRAEGNRIYPQRMPRQMRQGLPLYRNADAAFDKILARPTADRRIPLSLGLRLCEKGISLNATVLKTDIQVTVEKEIPHEMARQSQAENMRRQLSRLGGTVYQAADIVIDDDTSQCFVASSVLADLRRQMVEALDVLLAAMPQSRAHHTGPDASATPMREVPAPPPAAEEYQRYPYLYNITNRQAADFYAALGEMPDGRAFERGNVRSADGQQPPLLMQCRHCIRRLLGYCRRRGEASAPWREPLFLALPDGRRFRLQFDCKKCQMNVYADS